MTVWLVDPELSLSNPDKKLDLGATRHLPYHLSDHICFMRSFQMEKQEHCNILESLKNLLLLATLTQFFQPLENQSRGLKRAETILISLDRETITSVFVYLD